MKMMSRLWKVVSLVMALVFPLSMMAGNPGAMVVPSGSVTVNGNAVSHPAAIFAGDRIQTAAGTVAMSMTGSVVQVAPRSSAVLQSNELQLSGGGARILTTSGLSGRVRNLTVRPASDAKSVYTVAERDGKILVAALEGNLTLSDGHGQVMLAANHALAIPVQDSQNPPPAACQKGDKKCQQAVKACKGDKNCEAQAAGAAAGGAAAGAAGAGAAAAGATVSTAVAVGIAAAAAAVSAGLSYGIAVATSPSASPSKP